MNHTKIGVIVNTHGLKGTVKVKSFTDFKDERYKKGSQLLIQFKNQMLEVTVDKYKTVKTVEYIDFKEYSNINEVEKFKGCDLYIDNEYIHELEEDEYYFSELIGMDVYLDTYIGTVVDVLEMPRSQMLVVKRDGNKNAMIPFQNEFIDEVDKIQNKITIKYWEGLL